MAQSRKVSNEQSAVFRIDAPKSLNFSEQEENAPAPQRGAWRHLTNLFNEAIQNQAFQFSIEPDANNWRLRYRRVDGFQEQLVGDPTNLIWALDSLQQTLWGDEYNNIKSREIRFQLVGNAFNHVVGMRAVDAVNGDLLQFELETLKPMPPILDELGFDSKTLFELRERLSQHHGVVLLTSTEPNLLNDTKYCLSTAGTGLVCLVLIKWISDSANLKNAEPHGNMR